MKPWIVFIMFGALNRIIGRLDADPVSQPNQRPGDSPYGFQVLRNSNKELPLEPWFDFVIGINGHFIVGISSSVSGCS